MDDAIVVDNISKKFRIPHEKKTTLFQSIVGIIKRQYSYEEFWALKDISFSVKQGETFGIIGRNGSGKSTLLKILANVLCADSGTIKVNGKIAPFLELGVGFQPELTAKENIYIYSSIMGLSRKATNKVYDSIFEFSELKRFENMKLKNFSSGMYMRLAFSTAIYTDPEILLIDEVFAVGDTAFQKKCSDKINEFRKKGKTIIFVSHSLESMEAMCTRSILLDNGQIVMMGSTEKIIEKYLNSMDYKKPEIHEPPAIKITHPMATNRSPIKSNKYKILVGADADSSMDTANSGNYFVLSKFTSIKKGIIREIWIQCALQGDIKLAIYSDNNGEPGALIKSINTIIPVKQGWNSIPFPETVIEKGKDYWFAHCANENIVGAKGNSNSNRRFKQTTFSEFVFPNSAGINFTVDTTYFDLITGCG